MSDKDAILMALQASADEVTREVARLPEAATLWKPSEAEWCQLEVLTHLWIGEHYIFLPRIRSFTAPNQPPEPVGDGQALQKSEWDPTRPRDDLLASFLVDRQAELARLATADWEGMHPLAGPITLGWVAQDTLWHTWAHLPQLIRLRLDYELRGPQ